MTPHDYSGIIMKRIIGSAVLFLLAGLAGGPLRAADLATPMSAEPVQGTAGDWSFAVSPYFWAPGLSGTVAQFRLPPVHVSMNFSDILKNLDFAAMAIGEARNDRFSVFGDVMYTKLSTDSGTPRGLLASTVSLESSTFAGMLGGGYSILREGSSYLDIVGGARVWNVNSELAFHGGILGGRQASDSATWADAMVGTRMRYAITDNWYFTAWGLVGAGGAEIDWDVAAGLGYKFNSTVSAVAGYRALGVRYDRGGFVFDTVQQGPILGLVVRF